MRLLPYFSFVLLFLASCSPKVAPVMGDDGTDWNARAESYRDNPAALRDFVEDCERTQAELTQARQQLDAARGQSSEMESQITTAQASAEQAYQEIQRLRDQLAAAEEAASRPDEVITDQPRVEGVIFQVQLGAYAENRVDPNLATGDALDLTDQEGMQKVVVSQFRTYSNAAALRDRLKQMGVKDAFVVARNNGERIPVPEALRLTGQQ
jgi:isoleucyl-tRNA synthetase